MTKIRRIKIEKVEVPASKKIEALKFDNSTQVALAQVALHIVSLVQTQNNLGNNIEDYVSSIESKKSNLLN